VPADSPGDAMFGQSTTFSIQAERGARFLSLVSMLICTNDGFTGVNALKLPSQVGDGVTVETAGYDAGTELNTEDFADMVPPCQDHDRDRERAAQVPGLEADAKRVSHPHMLASRRGIRQAPSAGDRATAVRRGGAVGLERDAVQLRGSAHWGAAGRESGGGCTRAATLPS
jgi:hypothetical protein